MQTTPGFLIAALLILPPAAFASDGLRERQTAACKEDAYRFCSDEIPDEARVTACMWREEGRLSPACRAFFDTARGR